MKPIRHLHLSGLPQLFRCYSQRIPEFFGLLQKKDFFNRNNLDV